MVFRANYCAQPAMAGCTNAAKDGDQCCQHISPEWIDSRFIAHPGLSIGRVPNTAIGRIQSACPSAYAPNGVLCANICIGERHNDPIRYGKIGQFHHNRDDTKKMDFRGLVPASVADTSVNVLIGRFTRGCTGHRSRSRGASTAHGSQGAPGIRKAILDVAGQRAAPKFVVRTCLHATHALLLRLVQTPNDDVQRRGDRETVRSSVRIAVASHSKSVKSYMMTNTQPPDSPEEPELRLPPPMQPY